MRRSPASEKNATQIQDSVSLQNVSDTNANLLINSSLPNIVD